MAYLGLGQQPAWGSVAHQPGDPGRPGSTPYYKDPRYKLAVSAPTSCPPGWTPQPTTTGGNCELVTYKRDLRTGTCLRQFQNVGVDGTRSGGSSTVDDSFCAQPAAPETATCPPGMNPVSPGTCEHVTYGLRDDDCFSTTTTYRPDGTVFGRPSSRPVQRHLCPPAESFGAGAEVAPPDEPPVQQMIPQPPVSHMRIRPGPGAMPPKGRPDQIQKPPRAEEPYVVLEPEPKSEFPWVIAAAAALLLA